MKNLNYELKLICARNRDGSHATQANRARMLSLMAEQLHELRFKNMGATSLKEKHVQALVGLWQSQEISSATMKNRLSAIRWWAEKVDRANVVPRENLVLGVENRVLVTGESKAKALADGQLDLVTSPLVLASLELSREFGLRREESIKIKPGWADAGQVLRLQGSWTKGGRPREVPITTDAQRKALERAKEVAGQGSLIPKELSYRKHLASFRAQCQRAGINGVHGLRHQYAQQRYLEKTGWPAPAAGGPSRKQLTGEQRSVDLRARLEISLELGHQRVAILAIYLGS